MGKMRQFRKKCLQLSSKHMNTNARKTMPLEVFVPRCSLAECFLLGSGKLRALIVVSLSSPYPLCTLLLTVHWINFLKNRQNTAKKRDFHRRGYLIGRVINGSRSRDSAKHFAPTQTWGINLSNEQERTMWLTVRHQRFWLILWHTLTHTSAS